ncbi:DUF6456 domain-containing protein [Croceicoccus sp. BE223]|uniref:DUF6456 domain-containing protein n=1 Tax=Croceicoccus sp. BE223 TaxID=2817716 RepID=UPI0028616065|nr:DUF6456 domain-containing protein [Croceicoccus sp. BE223]MDR7101234.1 hypothetical protein [Croceicoccus sp. BE223]
MPETSNPKAAHYVTRELTSEGPRRTSAAYKGGAPKRGRSVTVNLRESPLSWLHARGHLSERQYEAGERIRSDWERAQLAPSITMRWDPVRVQGSGGDGLTQSERQVAAKRRFDAAVAAAGPGLADVLWRVACAGESLPDAEKALAWPARSGKLVLGLALDRVADYYRIR